MDGEERGRWLDRNPLTRTWYLLPRLPMMHRHGWEGAQIDEQHSALLGRLGGRRNPYRATARLLAGAAQPQSRLRALPAQLDVVAALFEPTFQEAVFGLARLDKVWIATQSRAHDGELFEQQLPRIAPVDHQLGIAPPVALGVEPLKPPLASRFHRSTFRQETEVAAPTRDLLCVFKLGLLDLIDLF
jgi:hypothetical protein